uniref:H15 domain-containing protein n=1 Tax=Angiostrongylus cantonensis TaxID=6313 RepID=A0A0K0DRV3_ANGCA
MSGVVVDSPTTITEASMPKEARKASSHPTYSVMIRKAVSELKEKSGSSKAAILKFMQSHFKLGANITRINFHLRVALKKAVVKGELKQVKGMGASGRFKLGKKKSISAAKKRADKKLTAKKHKYSKATTKKPRPEKKSKSTKTVKALKAKTGKKPFSKAVMPKASKSKVKGSKTKKLKA